MNDMSLTVPGYDAPRDDELTAHQERLIDGRTAEDLRQLARMPEGYVASAATPFDPRLAYELALEMAEPADVFRKYGYDGDGAARLLAHPVFIATLRKYRDEIVAGGVSFKLKAKVQAEDLLTHSYQLATDTEVPASVRADLIKWTAAVAGLGPPKEQNGKEGGGGAGAGFTLNITFSGPGPAGAGRPAIDVTPEAA